jgi:phenylacetate-CoA ligase
VPFPLQFLVPAQYDLAYNEMWEAYGGDAGAWRRVTEARRDAIVSYARRRSPYYERTIPEGTPFEEIPVLTKQVLRDHPDELLARDVPAWRRHTVRTSGSTGEPATLHRDIHQILIESMSSDRFLRSLHGVPFDATIVAVTSTGTSRERLSRWDRVKGWAIERLGGPRAYDPWLLTAPISDVRRARTLQSHLDLWARLRRYVFLGQASALDRMARLIEAGEVRMRRPPVAIAASSDILTARAKERIERAFGAWVHTRYGAVEMPFLSASMPNTTDRYVFNPLLAYVEVLDRDGRPVGPGEMGRVVVTDLNNRVMPLIRYDLGDLAVASEERSVGGFPLVEGVMGRASEVLRFPSGRTLTAVDLDRLVFSGATSVRAWQCVQTDANHLEVRVVWDAEPDDLAGRLGATVRSAVDADTSVAVRTVTELESYPSGKVWLVRGLGSNDVR